MNNVPIIIASFQNINDTLKQQDKVSYDLWNIIAHPVVSSVLAGIIVYFLTYFFFTRRIERTYVKIIKKSDDKDLFDFIDLYERTIDEHLRINSSEILNWLEKKNDPLIKNYGVEHYLFLCKTGKSVIGFMKVMYCLSSNNLFIAYMGIDKNIIQARKIASEIMLKTLLKFVRKNYPKCKAIFIELEKPNSKDDHKTNAEKLARIRLFGLFSKRYYIIPYIIDIPYLQPEMPTDIEDHHKEEELLLMYYPLTRINSSTISKEEVLRILEFIYFNIYGPSYRKDITQDIAYREYLQTLLRLYEDSLKSSVNLIPGL